MNYFSITKFKREEFEVIITDEIEVCWKFKTTRDMNFSELMLNVRAQFYLKEDDKGELGGKDGK